MMQNSAYFLVGTMYGGKIEQLDKWIAQNVWKLGWIGEEDNKNYQKMKKIWDDIEVGDYLIVKNMDLKKGYSGIKVKAIAKVVGKEDDGHTINVKWLKVFQKGNYPSYQISASKTMRQIDEKIGSKIVSNALENN